MAKAIMRFTANPFEEMERLFDQTRRSMRVGSGSAMRPYQGNQGVDVLSSTDVNLGMEATDDGYVVTADMPGFEKDDIELRFEVGVLTIRADVEVAEETPGAYHHRRRRVSEQFYVPGDVVEDEIEAALRNGVLEITLPTRNEVDADAHRIDID
jgi:HSP20 family protein